MRLVKVKYHKIWVDPKEIVLMTPWDNNFGKGIHIVLQNGNTINRLLNKEIIEETETLAKESKDHRRSLWDIALEQQEIYVFER